MKSIICFGDSNTYGYDPTSWDGSRYPDSQYWVELLHQKTGWNFWNMGMCGKEIPHTDFQIRTVCQELAAREKTADQLWIMLGTNDLLESPEIGVRGASLRMERFLHAVLETWKKQNVYLISPVKMGEGTWVSSPKLIEESANFPSEYKILAKKLGIRFISTEGWDIPLAFDGVHFTEEGHRRFADSLYRVVH